MTILRLDFGYFYKGFYLLIIKNILSKSSGWEVGENGSGDREIFVLFNIFIDDLNKYFFYFFIYLDNGEVKGKWV